MSEAAVKTDNCTWNAVHDFQPVQPPRLRVTGSCMMPTPGYQLALKRAVPQGINPAILILELSVTRPTGNVSTVVTKTDVRYEEQTDQRYTSVTIRPGDISVPVQEVH